MSRRSDSSRQRTPVQRVLGNLGYLIRGRAVAALMMIGATILMARALGPASFGVVMLIQAYALLMRGLLNCRVFNAVIRYGVPAHDAGDLRTLRRLLRVCHRVDRGSSIAATLLAVLLAPWIGPLMGVGHEHVVLLAAYSLVLLTTGNNTPDGILRLFDRFDVIGWQMTTAAVISLVGVAIAAWWRAPLPVYVAVLGVAYATEQLCMSWLGWGEYRRRIGPSVDDDLRTARLAEFRGLRGFLWVNYWQSNMDLVPKHLATVLAGLLLGATSAGLLRLSRQISSVLSKLAILTRQAVFPDLTRSWHQRDASFAHLTFRTATYVGGFGLVLVAVVYFFGHALLGTVVGAKYIAAAPLLSLMMLAATFDLAAAPMRSAAYAIGRAGKVLGMYAIAAAIYLALFVVLAPWLDLVGIGLATVVAACLPMLAMVVLIQRHARPTPG